MSGAFGTPLSKSDMHGGVGAFFTRLQKVQDEQRPANRFAKISVINAEIARQLLETAKKANEAGQKATANSIMTSIGQLLDNNKDLQEVVIEIKPKLD